MASLSLLNSCTLPYPNNTKISKLFPISYPITIMMNAILNKQKCHVFSFFLHKIGEQEGKTGLMG
jgi:hypothetical protein